MAGRGGGWGDVAGITTETVATIGPPRTTRTGFFRLSEKATTSSGPRADRSLSEAAIGVWRRSGLPPAHDPDRMFARISKADRLGRPGASAEENIDLCGDGARRPRFRCRRGSIGTPDIGKPRYQRDHEERASNTSCANWCRTAGLLSSNPIGLVSQIGGQLASPNRLFPSTAIRGQHDAENPDRPRCGHEHARKGSDRDFRPDDLARI